MSKYIRFKWRWGTKVEFYYIIIIYTPNWRPFPTNMYNYGPLYNTDDYLEEKNANRKLYGKLENFPSFFFRFNNINNY